ncbi:putative 4-amino-4-deoxychorismate protein [Xylaria cf. heliscus]|nr:putative 4-amino-4-deoxychorismate protein [Xylaria cf. heliscus]
MDELQLFTTIRCDPALLNAPGQGFIGIGWNQNPSPFYMLDFHRDRVLNAAIHWGWDAAVRTLDGENGLEALETFLQANIPEVTNTPYRVKVLIDRDGVLSVIKQPTPPINLDNLFPSYLPVPSGHAAKGFSDGKVPARNFEWEILVDRHPTAKSEFTHFKTTHRSVYDEARQRVNILNPTDKKEVLLVNNEDGSVMEGSITTPYFWRNGGWVTPPIPKNYDFTQGSGGNYGTSRRWALERKLAVENIVHVDSLIDGEEIWISNGLKGFVHGKLRLI